MADLAVVNAPPTDWPEGRDGERCYSYVSSPENNCLCEKQGRFYVQQSLIGNKDVKHIAQNNILNCINCVIRLFWFLSVSWLEEDWDNLHFDLSSINGNISNKLNWWVNKTSISGVSPCEGRSSHFWNKPIIISWKPRWHNNWETGLSGLTWLSSLGVAEQDFDDATELIFWTASDCQRLPSNVALDFWFLRSLTHCLSGLNHAATGRDHGISNLLPSLAVLHRAAGDNERKQKGSQTRNHAPPSPSFLLSSSLSRNYTKVPFLKVAPTCLRGLCNEREAKQTSQVVYLMIRTDLWAETSGLRFPTNGQLNAVPPGFISTATWCDSNTQPFTRIPAGLTFSRNLTPASSGQTAAMIKRPCGYMSAAAEHRRLSL